MTDNGPAYVSIAHAIACRALKIRHIYRDSSERTAALSGWLAFYNWRRPHGSLSHRPPGARLAELNNVAGSCT
jgi:transposase InsO family protein